MSRINRNIVECKDAKVTMTDWSKPVLIETLWNVKIIKFLMRFKWFRVLIETLWNVKEAGRGSKSPRRCSINRNIVECKVEKTATLALVNDEY